MKRRTRQTKNPSKKKKSEEGSDDIALSSNGTDHDDNHDLFIPHHSKHKLRTNSVITTVVEDVPSFRVCWAQIYSFPYWPCKILLPHEIPSDVIRKKKTKNTLCVFLFGKNECAWTSPSRIINFEEYPDYPPDARKRPLSSLLVTAIESAKNEIKLNPVSIKPLIHHNTNSPFMNEVTQNYFNPLITLPQTIIEIDSPEHTNETFIMEDNVDILNDNHINDHTDCEGIADITKGKIKTYFIPPKTSHSRYDRPSSKGQVDHITLTIKNRRSIPIEEISFIGLLNLGNTCYINSALQSLHSLSFFSNTFIDLFRTPYHSVDTQISDVKNGFSVGMENSSINVKKQISRNGKSSSKHDDDTLSSETTVSVEETKKDSNLLHSLHTMLEYLSNINKFIHRTENSFHTAANDESSEDGYIDPIGNDDDINIDDSAPQIFEENEERDYEDLIHALVSFRESSGSFLDEKYLTDQLQDINEFITQLLEYIHQQQIQQCQLVLKNNKRHSLKKDQLLSTASFEHWRNYIQSSPSFIVNTFDGLLRRKRICPNGHMLLSYEVFRTLTLHFDDEKEISLGNMLMKFKSPEIIECRCSSCGGRDNKLFSQTTDVYLYPKYLIITLGRFQSSVNNNGKAYSWWAHKIKTRVKFPTDHLDMSQYFDIASDQMKPLYNLVAVSNHKGSSLHGGHYFSYVRASKKNETWVLLNDTMIKTVHKDSIVTNQAYMLFYERIT